MENTPVHLIDVMPTIVEAAGASYPERIGSREIFRLAGASLISVLHGARMPERTLYFEHEGHRAVRENRYKATALRGQPWSLYDMEKDRTERHDIADQNPDRGRQMADDYARWAKLVGAQSWPMPETPQRLQEGAMPSPPYLRKDRP